MRAIEISIAPAGCAGGNKERISGKIKKHLKVHSSFIVRAPNRVMLTVQQGFLYAS
jgi:hypothetical protein